MDSDLRAELILRCVECIPAGKVASYGDIAHIVELSPRVVGRVMATFGSSVPWWRVTNVKGELPSALLIRARPLWEAEGITLACNGRGIRLSAHRADLRALKAAWRQRAEPLLTDMSDH